MKTFINVAQMKLATLQADQFVETGGYYTKGGSGAARYLVVAPQAFDGQIDIELANGNIAVWQYDQSITSIARSLNVLDTEVIYADDIVTILDSIIYIYDSSSQTSWVKPTIGAGEVIVSVVGSALVTSGGSYTLEPLAIATSLSSSLSSNQGAGLVGTTAGISVQANIDALQAGQTAGVVVFATYALLDAYTPAAAQESASFKVTNDPTSSLNGYYSWVSGSAYIKDADLVVNVIDENNTSDAVSGFAVSKAVLGLNDLNYQDAGMSVSKTNFYTLGKNVLNIAESESGFRGANGVLTASTTYNVSDFIKVTASTSYSYSVNGVSAIMRFHTAYDEAKNVVSSEGSDTNATVLNVPATGVKYYKISYDKTQEPLNQLESGAVTPFESFGYKAISIIKQKTIANADIALDSIAPLQTQFLINSVNLFDDATTESGFRGANGVLVASTSYRVSDFIEVSPSTTYVSSDDGVSSLMRFHTAYDENKTVVVSEGSDNDANTISVPATGVKYYKITVGVEKTKFQLEAGSTATAFVPYGFGFTNDINLPLGASPWVGLDWVSFGDSITQANGYQPYVASELEFNSIVRGVGGSQISGSSTDSFNTDTRIATLPTTCDALTMMGGTNDWAQNTALGTASLTNVDVSTFYGAINVTLTKLFAKYPLARITINTTPYGEISDYAPRGWINAYTNTQGLTTRDYSAACKIAGNLWGVTVFEVQERAGWNTHNITDFVADGLHPNSAGYRRIAEVVASGLKSIKLTT